MFRQITDVAAKTVHRTIVLGGANYDPSAGRGLLGGAKLGSPSPFYLSKQSGLNSEPGFPEQTTPFPYSDRTFQRGGR